MTMIRRRTFLRSSGLASLALGLPGGALLASSRFEARFVFIILRGGMDGLMAVPAWKDPDFTRQREGLVMPPPGQAGGVLDLDGFFALHPDLRQLHRTWQAGDLLPIHAVATPYRQRSHFDAQNVLEHGLAVPDRRGDGWLNRALPGLGGGAAAPGRELAMALGHTIPRVLRGSAAVGAFDLDLLPDPDPDTVERLRGLYAGDAVLGPRLEAALQAQGLDMGASSHGRSLRPEPRLAEAAAGFLTQDQGPRLAVLEMGGWDSHADQPGMRWRLRVLDEALARLRDGLGTVWRHTVVLVATEFGRTVAMNGSGGTDHGTGAAAFLLGGAVAGGRVLADWPGLSHKALRDGRDLAATLDLRRVTRTVLHDHLGLARRRLDEDVFPDGADLELLPDLLV
ncbi:MAG: DUF1501 domain-containing protein [Gammaproteobacteria bacterium]|nr:DUF1501 domain-containing protein [Gammaproteobacteria bacterium]